MTLLFTNNVKSKASPFKGLGGFVKKIDKEN